VWTIDQSRQELVHVNVASGLVAKVIPLRHFPCCSTDALGSGVAVGHGRIWVALQSP